MRLVARNALSVPVSEDRSTRNQGFSGSMARLTRLPRLSCRRMLARMARGTALYWVLALGRMESVHILVTGSARS